MSRVLTSVPIAALPIERFASVLDASAYRRVLDHAKQARELLAGRVVWNVNSTARGGGVAEMLISLLAYGRGAGVDTRWEVIDGDPEYFVVTKRIHNQLHGSVGDGLALDAAARSIFATTTRQNAEALAGRVAAGDIVLLHDPQTAGMIPLLKERGAHVVWRCHVGIDAANDVARSAWDFLRGYVQQADAYVFSRQQHAWDGLDAGRTVLIPPSIDAFSAKNHSMTAGQVGAILAASGLQEGGDHPSGATYARLDGVTARVRRRAEVVQQCSIRPQDRVVLQVSRWDLLKDPLGVIGGFAEHVAPHCDAHLIYAGPSVAAVTDDPEGAAVLAMARARFAELPSAAQHRIHLVTLPMVDLEENAAIVNALQRRADVVVQKSLAEGFGLTVAEAMWKGRPVVASRIGGIQDQIEHGRSGLLIDDPLDLGAFGHAVRCLLDDPALAATIGREGKLEVGRRFLGARSLVQYVDLFENLLRDRIPAAAATT